MKANVGTVDRALRIIVGLALIAFALLATNVSWSWVGWIGVVPLVTGLFSRCPAYSLLGIDTCPMDDSRHGQPG
ncbi:MAG TPA: DUF2892 domain-containing protein [Afifellaceae bacterium]|nr:DUF2892 domain-containing protein [Afifellaceae bacterium]